MTRVLVNGEEHLLSDVCDLASVVASVVVLPEGVSAAPTGVAAAVNDRVVPRSTWSSVVLRDDDRVEIVSAVQGG